jgi:hypothetical protein
MLVRLSDPQGRDGAPTGVATEHRKCDRLEGAKTPTEASKRASHREVGPHPLPCPPGPLTIPMALRKAGTGFRSNTSWCDANQFDLPVRLGLVPASSPSVLQKALGTRLQAEGYRQEVVGRKVEVRSFRLRDRAFR